MKKGIRIDFSRLDRQLETVGGRRADIVSDSKTQELIEALGKEGYVEVSGEDLERVETVDGLLSFAGAQITLHLYQASYPTRQEVERGEKPKFHVTDCTALKNMDRINRIDRYIFHALLDEPFRVRHISHRKGIDFKRNIPVCLFCLNQLRNKRQIPRHIRTPDDFDRAKFFEKHKEKFPYKPRYDRHTYPEGGYPKNWNEITVRIKEKNGWSCNCCGVNVARQERRNRMLETHHINGIPADTRESNLEPLCTPCHKNQPLHSRLIVNKGDRELIRQLREKQDLPHFCPKCRS